MTLDEKMVRLFSTTPGVVGDGLLLHFGISRNLVYHRAAKFGLSIERVGGIGFRKKVG